MPLPCIVQAVCLQCDYSEAGLAPAPAPPLIPTNTGSADDQNVETPSVFDLDKVVDDYFQALITGSNFRLLLPEHETRRTQTRRKEAGCNQDGGVRETR